VDFYSGVMIAKLCVRKWW